jgi:hypothetical protein
MTTPTIVPYEVAILAARIMRILVDADLVHPIAEVAGEDEALEWAIEFSNAHGTRWNRSTITSPGGGQRTMTMEDFDNELVETVFRKAAYRGWVNPEVRDKPSKAGTDYEFHRELFLAQRIRMVPASVPRSRPHQILVEKVVEDLQRLALDQMPGDGALCEQMTVEPDGRFKVLKFHGIPIATHQASDMADNWKETIRGNLGLKDDPSHSVCIMVDGKEVLRTSADVQVLVTNDRMTEGDDAAVDLKVSFTHEGVVNDILSGNGASLGSDASMYGEIVYRLADDQTSLNADRMS